MKKINVNPTKNPLLWFCEKHVEYKIDDNYFTVKLWVKYLFGIKIIISSTRLKPRLTIGLITNSKRNFDLWLLRNFHSIEHMRYFRCIPITKVDHMRGIMFDKFVKIWGWGNLNKPTLIEIYNYAEDLHIPITENHN
jgi:hypothetical protein